MIASTIVASLAAAIRSRPATDGVRVVGVDGPAGSGKSTLAAALADAMAASVVHVDDFLSWTDLEGWWPRFDRDALTPLASGMDARYQLRDWLHDEFGTSLRGWKTTPAAPVVIVEGVSTTRRVASGRLTYTIWVEAERDCRLERGLARDGYNDRDVWLRWMAMEDRFFDADDTRARADVRIDTSD